MKLSVKAGAKDMTEGSILRLLLVFAFPLMVGNFFQLLYNTVDAYVVGNYVGKTALGAVGSTGSIVNMVVSIFTGMSGGAGAVISQYFGAKDEEKVRTSVHTAIILTVVIGIASTFVGVVFADDFLIMMKTPKEILPEAITYLRIYFSGIMGLMIYNIFAGILRAVGDSQSPFYALIVSSLVNVALDLLFVRVFDLGVAGVAYATLIAQVVSSVFLAVVLIRAKGPHRISFKGVSYSRDILKMIIVIGLPTAIHMGITAFSNIFVQSYINAFGENVTTAWSSYGKIDQIVHLPMLSIALATTTFVGQNLGADKVERAKKGIRTAIYLSLGITAVLMLPILIFAPEITAIFNKDATVVHYGAYILRLITPFYLAFCINQVISSALRGAGITKIPMIFSLGSFVFFRQAYLFVINQLNYGGNLTLVALSYPFGWIVCSAIYLVYYNVSGWEKKYALAKNKNK